MGIGKKLSDRINQQGLTKKQVAEAAHVPATTLYSIIQRDNTKVEIDAFLRICDVLGCKPEDFASDIPKSILPDEYILNKNEKKLINLYRGFNEEGQNNLMRYATDLSEMDKYKKCSDIEQNIG